MIQLLSPAFHTDYELIDTGGFEKLERFGAYILRRPEPQAVWKKHLSEGHWESLSNASFLRDKKSLEKGSWELHTQVPDRWYMEYASPSGVSLQAKCSLSAFKHVGIFPEQAENWEYIRTRLANFPADRRPTVLNLFAYTGLASVVAQKAGAEVTHVDSVKQVVSWAKDNMLASNTDHIRWIVDDALKFVKRELRRGKQYNGIILDPPAYGRGPDGEKWVLEEQIGELLETCKDLLSPTHYFQILNMYSLSFSALIVENLVNSFYEFPPNHEWGELYLTDRAGRKLPLGVFSRFTDLGRSLGS